MGKTDISIEYEVFRNKKIMFFVPHEDDEINLAGGLIYSLRVCPCEIYVVYFTNGDYFEHAMVRIREAKKSLHILGVKEENITFLGYSDHIDSNDTHLYMEKNLWKSNKGYTETFGAGDAIDYRFSVENKHSSFNRESFIKDIKDVILERKADFLFCADFDSHPDHRALSLGFEHAVGVILNENKEYRPFVFKGFAYPTAYKGVPDFGKSDNYTKFQTEAYNDYPLQNPYYVWDERKSFPVCSEAKRLFIARNPIYKALSKHSSQLIIKQYRSIINKDQVFWQRRTDNLMYEAKVNSSSGETQYLHDFLMFDCSDIMHGNRKKPNLDLAEWIPDINDKEPSVSVSFDRAKPVKSMTVYKGISCFGKKLGVEVRADNQIVPKSFEDDRKIIFSSFPENDIHEIKMLFSNAENGHIACSEIEINNSGDDFDFLNFDMAQEVSPINKWLALLNTLILTKDYVIARIARKIRNTVLKIRKIN